MLFFAPSRRLPPISERFSPANKPLSSLRIDADRHSKHSEKGAGSRLRIRGIVACSFIVLILLSGFVQPARAQAGGPSGGIVSALAIDPASPNVVFAGSLSGVFKSTNGGASWVLSNSGLPLTADVRALTIDPTSHTTIYLGTLINGAFKSTDGGATWTAINSGLNHPFIVSVIAVDPTTPATVWAGTDDGVFKSVDGGSSWNLSGASTFVNS